MSIWTVLKTFLITFPSKNMNLNGIYHWHFISKNTLDLDNTLTKWSKCKSPIRGNETSCASWYIHFLRTYHLCSIQTKMQNLNINMKAISQPKFGAFYHTVSWNVIVRNVNVTIDSKRLTGNSSKRELEIHDK